MKTAVRKESESMKIDDLVADAGGAAEVDAGGIQIPVRGLNALREQGYEKLRPYRSENTVSVWGKTCSGCFTREQLLTMTR